MRSRSTPLSMLVVLVVAFACGTRSAAPDACSDADISDGACRTEAGMYYQPCSGKVVATVPTDDCPAEHCAGRFAYAECNGEEWISCVCSIPPGYTLVDADFFGPDGGEGGS